MSLLKDIVLPASIEEELKRTVAAIPSDALVQLATEDRTFAHGHRTIPANAKFFRQRLTTLLNASIPLPPGPLQTIRMHSLYQDFTCVLSSEALLHGFVPLAHFIGGARLLLAMLLDPRETVHQYACDFLQSNAPIPKPAPTPEAARMAMHELFSPFLETMETILLPASPPPPTRAIQPSQQPADKPLAKKNQTLQNRVASLEAKNAKLSTRIKIAKEQLATRQHEAAQADEALQCAKTEASAQRKRTEQLETQFSKTKATLKQAENDIASLRTLLYQTQEENDRLSSRIDELNVHIAERKLAAQTAAANRATQQRTEFITSLNTILPAKPTSRTTRERLAASLDCRINEHEKLTILIDGYNVILRVPKYGAEFCLENKAKTDTKLKSFREALEHDVRVIQSKLGDCKINLYYDGPIPGTANPFCTPNIKISYSGGKGDHRADTQIIGYIGFFSDQRSEEKLITVTDDNAIRKEAMAQGSFVLATTEFIALA